MVRVFLADCQPLRNQAREALLAEDALYEAVGRCSRQEEVLVQKMDLNLVLDTVGEGALGVVLRTFALAPARELMTDG